MENCTHPESEREPYHDCTVMCRACNCVIEQYGKRLEKPCPLGPVFPSFSSPAHESPEKRLADIKKNWLYLVANADDQAPCDVVIARGDYETMMSLICGDS